MENNEKTKKNKYLIIIVILLIIIIALGAYILMKNDNNDSNNLETADDVAELSIESDNSKQIAVCYDSYNEKDILYKVITLGEEIAYSIDYGCDSPNGDTMTFKKYLSDQGMAIMINGYPNKTPEEMGCANADEAYMATQMAIWEIMNRTSESESSNEIFRVDNVTPIEGKEEFCDRVVTAAKKLVKYAEEEPYTSVPTMTIDNANVDLHDLNGDALIGPYTITISGTDETTIKSIKVSLVNAPESARVTDENGIDKTLISNGDTVYVKMSRSEEDTKFNIRFESYVNRKVGQIYEESDKMTQDYIKIGTEPNKMDKELTINWQTVTTLGKIKLECFDKEGNPVVGSTFGLIDSEGDFLGESKTGGDGIITFYKVPEGEYTLKQTGVAEGYELIGEDSKKVTVVGGETSTINFENSIITGTLNIDVVDETGKAIENATFEIMDNYDNIVSILSSDKDGKANITLEYGVYYLTQKSTSDGLGLDESTYAVLIDKDNRTFNKTFENK